MQHGAEQLAEWIALKGYSQTAAADKLGLHKTTLNKILKRTRLPGRLSATVIRDTAGIPLDAWVPTRVATRRKSDRRKAQKHTDWQAANA